MKKRPLAILILSCVFLATGVIGILYHLSKVKVPEGFPVDLVWIFGASLAAIVCGAFMLRGKNWARWLALAWITFHVILSMFHSLQEVLMHGLLWLVFAYILFRPEARAYFSMPDAS